MTGWSQDKVDAFRDAFEDFRYHIKINSKETGAETILGDNIYEAQRRFDNCIFEGLRNDIHDFKILKSRQLGISTDARAFSLFWLGMHPGLQGAMVFDTGDHREEARMELMDMVNNLPEKLKFPKTQRDSRGIFKLSNGSSLRFLNAGVKKSKSAGTLGRSSGLNFAHCSELCSWDNDEGLVSFQNALSEKFPDRLYIYESTARGFNRWYRMWEDAKADTLNQMTCFIGWWAKETQMIPKDSPLFKHYGIAEPNDQEKSRIEEVERLYGFSVSREQLAWYRRKTNPRAEEQEDNQKIDELLLQEQPWTAEEAFLQTGSSFFSGERLSVIAKTDASDKYKGYDFVVGTDFFHCDFHPVIYTKRVQLKVWEEPEEGGMYLLCADPAFGHKEENNHSAFQIMRCYADKLVQVAEYANSVIETQPFSWAIMSVASWYRDTYIALELNGPGGAVWEGMKNLKALVNSGHMRAEAESKGLRDMFRNIHNYLFMRTDSSTQGTCFHFRTTQQLKVEIMERLRDMVSDGTLEIKSFETLAEMKAIVRDGDTIGAEGRERDDRTFCLAMGVRYWEQSIRRSLSLAGRTKATEDMKKKLTLKDQIGMFNKHALDTFLKGNQAQKKIEQTIMRRRAWRGR